MLLPQEMAFLFFFLPDGVGVRAGLYPLGTDSGQTPGIPTVRTCPCGTLGSLVWPPSPSHSLPASRKDPKFESLLFQQVRTPEKPAPFSRLPLKFRIFCLEQPQMLVATWVFVSLSVSLIHSCEAKQSIAGFLPQNSSDLATTGQGAQAGPTLESKGLGMKQLRPPIYLSPVSPHSGSQPSTNSSYPAPESKPSILHSFSISQMLLNFVYVCFVLSQFLREIISLL